MGCEHDWCGLIQWDGHQARGPSWAGGDAVCRVGHDVSREPLKGLVEQGEGHGRCVGSHDGPIPLVIANVAAMQSITAHVVILRDLRGHALDGEGAILDAVGVPAHDWTEVGEDRLIIADKVGGVVIP